MYDFNYLAAPQGGRFQPKTVYSDVAATHVSHFGMGGYMEVPNIEDLYSIPCYSGSNYINSDGISTGRRKYGMIVYVISQGKYYQLRPRFKGTKEVIPWDLFMALPGPFRRVLIDPSIEFSQVQEGDASESESFYFTWSSLEADFSPEIYANLSKYGWSVTGDFDQDGVEETMLLPGLVVGQGGWFDPTLEPGAEGNYLVAPSDGTLPSLSDPWIEIFVKGNFNTLTNLEDYISSDGSAYAGQICSVIETGKVYLVINGTGEAVGALDLLEIGSGGAGGGDDLLNDDLQVKGVSIGSYEDGELIEKDTPLETIIRNILQKRIPPTYTQPDFSIETTTTLSHEIGSSISPTITASWTQNNAGPLIAYNLYKNSSLVLGPSSSVPLTHFTDSSFVLSSNVSYNGSVTWQDGDILDNNMSEPDPGICPNCRVISNSSNPKTSNTITFVPKRAAFYTADAGTSIPTASQIRNFTKNLNIVDGSTFTINISTTVKRIVIAYLKSYGLMSSVIDSGTGYNIVSSFGAPVEVSIEGANGYEGALYYVYTSILGSNYKQAVVYTVTI
jgi:hypothetical protein